MFGSGNLHVRELILYDAVAHSISKWLVFGLANLRYGLFHVPHSITITPINDAVDVDAVRACINSIPERLMTSRVASIDMQSPTAQYEMMLTPPFETDIGLIHIDIDREILNEFGRPSKWEKHPDSRSLFRQREARQNDCWRKEP